jgi:hypothetical protein
VESGARGVYGRAWANGVPVAGLYGVYGVADGGDWSAGRYGVYGTVDAGGNEPGFAIFGFAPISSVYAGYFSGDVHVSGELTATTKSFKIDHPLDPAGRYLQHSCVESPDMKNVYDGVVVLDSRGAATIELPDYFEVLNRDFRYQLTAIGAPGPNLHISREVDVNTFAVAGGEPGMKVSWQITGIRHDPSAEAHRVQVEKDKPAHEHGRYLDPEAYGMPRSEAIGSPPSIQSSEIPLPTEE